jgi:hypothetical protein
MKNQGSRGQCDRDNFTLTCFSSRSVIGQRPLSLVGDGYRQYRLKATRYGMFVEADQGKHDHAPQQIDHGTGHDQVDPVSQFPVLRPLKERMSLVLPLNR